LPSGAVVDLVVAPGVAVVDALAVDAPMLVLLGRVRPRRLRAAGYTAFELVSRPGRDGPRLLVPTGDRRVLRHVFARPGPGPPVWRRARNVALPLLLPWGVGARPRDVVTLAARAPAPPFLVAAAIEAGVPAGASWFLLLGEGDDAERAVIGLFPPGGTSPAWVLKFVRVPGDDHSVAREEHGLALAHAAGPTTASRVPGLVARLHAAGHHATVETAAPGTSLDRRLRVDGASPATRALVDAVATWIVAVGRETAQPAPSPASGLPGGALGGVGVLAHGDLRAWNVLVASDEFTVVDWELARRPGLPLADLLLFLCDALALVDGTPDLPTRVERIVALLRGDSPHSPWLFAWVRRAVSELGIPESVVGELATRMWQQQLEAGQAREARLAVLGATPVPSATIVERAVVERWSSDPTLGPSWDRWKL